MKRITIRNSRSRNKQNPRVFDILIDGEDVYLEIKTGKAESELVPVSDVLDQIIAATGFPNQNIPDQSPVCPRCHCNLERVYQSFCDCRGQKLGWDSFHYATLMPEN